MKKILFYTSFITIGGGLQKVSIDYLEILVQNGFQVDLISDFNMGKDVSTFEYILPKEVTFQYLKSEKISKFIYYFRTIGKKNHFFNIILYALMIFFDFYYYHTKMKKIIQRGSYHFTISFYQFLPSYITSIKSLKHIIWLHGSVEHFFGGMKNLFKGNYEKKLNKYDYIVTIADEMKQQLESFYPNLSKIKIKRIYNPFNFNEIITKSNDVNSLTIEEKKLMETNYICAISRLDENQKDLKTLILAYKKLFSSHCFFNKLFIIGDGPDFDALIDFTNKLNLQKQIFFLGKKINPYVWMKNAKLLVLSSKFEGLPTVLIESMAVETFVIASNCKTGPNEILCNGECGELFAVGNIDELAKKIELVLGNENYKSEKILKAKERIKEFDKMVVKEQFIKILESTE